MPRVSVTCMLGEGRGCCVKGDTVSRMCESAVGIRVIPKTRSCNQLEENPEEWVVLGNLSVKTKGRSSL